MAFLWLMERILLDRPEKDSDADAGGAPSHMGANSLVDCGHTGSVEPSHARAEDHEAKEPLDES